MEVWREVPGYNGRYFASNEGRIKSYTGHILSMIKRCHRGRVRYMVTTTTRDNRRVGAGVARMVWLAFHGIPPDGYMVVHKNGYQHDNRLSNLMLMPRKSPPLIPPNRKPVLKLSKSGEILAHYSSAQEAGDANYFAEATISKRALGQVKYPLDGGIDFCYDTNESYKMALKRLGLKPMNLY